MPAPATEDRLLKTIHYLLLIAVIGTPLFALREFVKFFGVEPPAYALYLNIAKDILMAAVAILSIWFIVMRKKYPRNVFAIGSLFFAFTFLVVGLSFHDPLMVAGGLRWCMPLILLFLLPGIIDKPFIQKLTNAVAVLLLLNTGVQLYELFTRQFLWGGGTYLGFLGRVPGFYELPSIAGFMSCLSFFLVYYFFTGPIWLKRLLLLVSIVSTFFLSISATGILLMLVLIFVPFFFHSSRYWPLYLVLTAGMLVLVYFHIDLISGRYEGGSAVSWNTRVILMKQAIQESQIISTRFGQATNAVSIVKGIFHQPVPAQVAGGSESFYPTIVGNYGLLFFVLFIVLLMYLLVKTLVQKREAPLIFFLLVVLGCTTIRLTETYPVGLLVAIITAYFISKKHSNHLPATEA